MQKDVVVVKEEEDKRRGRHLRLTIHVRESTTWWCRVLFHAKHMSRHAPSPTQGRSIRRGKCCCWPLTAHAQCYADQKSLEYTSQKGCQKFLLLPLYNCLRWSILLWLSVRHVYKHVEYYHSASCHFHFKMSAEASCSQPMDESRKSKSPSEDRQQQGQGTYECNICLETANDPVVSLCGHLYW